MKRLVVGWTRTFWNARRALALDVVQREPADRRGYADRAARRLRVQHLSRLGAGARRHVLRPPLLLAVHLQMAGVFRGAGLPRVQGTRLAEKAGPRVRPRQATLRPAHLSRRDTCRCCAHAPNPEQAAQPKARCAQERRWRSERERGTATRCERRFARSRRRSRQPACVRARLVAGFRCKANWHARSFCCWPCCPLTMAASARRLNSLCPARAPRFSVGSLSLPVRAGPHGQALLRPHSALAASAPPASGCICPSASSW